MNVYKLASLGEMVVVKNSIISIIKIPIINRELFTCRKIIPVPFKRAKLTETLSIGVQYVLFNQNTTQYCIKAGHEMQECFSLNNSFFCEMEKKATENANICEINIATKSSDGNCVTREFNENEFMVNIKPSTWLFYGNDTLVSIVCGSATCTERFQGTGILKLDPECNVNINNSIYRNLHSVGSDVYIDDERYETISFEEAATAHNTLYHLKSAVDDLKYTQQLHHWYHAHHALILYIFIAWIVFCLVLMLLRKRQNTVQHPVVTISK